MKRLRVASVVTILALTAIGCSQATQGDISAEVAPSTTAAPRQTSSAPAVSVRAYTESGPGTKTFALDLGAAEAGIVGGYNVDGVAHGVYRIICGPATFRTTVTDGFAVIVAADMAEGEFSKHLKAATDHGWARDSVTHC